MALGSAAQDAHYRVLVNEKGQILLDPMVSIPLASGRSLLDLARLEL